MPDRETVDANIESSSSEPQDAISESSPEPDENAESSPAEPEPESAEPKKPYHLDPRFKELEAERNYWREKYLIDMQAKGVKVEDEPDPYAGMDPQTMAFMQNLDRRNQKMFNKLLAEREQKFQRALENMSTKTAMVMERMFRQDNKDVIPDSPEEKRIATLIAKGIDPEEAAWAVLGPKRAAAAKEEREMKKLETVKIKQRANLENGGIPQNSGIPEGRKLSFVEKLTRNMNKAGF